MAKTYCTQNSGRCATCPLANYGLDCQSNPITASGPTQGKIDRAFAIAGLPNMPTVRAHIWRNVSSSVPKEVLHSMTAKQIAGVISAANSSYHDGRASAGVEACDDCVWISQANKLVPIEALKQISAEERREEIMRPGKSTIDDSYLADGTRVPRDQAHRYSPEELYIRDTRIHTTYSMDYTETC